MQKAFAPTASEAVELIREALAQGHTIILPASDRPSRRFERVDRALTAPPLRASLESSLVAICRQLLQLTPAESRLFVHLLKHTHATRAELHHVLSHDSDPVTGIKIVGVVICTLRKKLAVHSVGIVNIHGLGYRLADGARDKTRNMLAAYGADIVDAVTPPAGHEKEKDATE